MKIEKNTFSKHINVTHNNMLTYLCRAAWYLKFSYMWDGAWSSECYILITHQLFVRNSIFMYLEILQKNCVQQYENQICMLSLNTVEK